MTEMIANRLKRIIKYTYNSNNFSWLKKEQMKSLFFYDVVGLTTDL